MHLKITEIKKEQFNGSGDAKLLKGYNIDKNGIYTRYIITHEKIKSSAILNAKNPRQNEDFPSDVAVIYPPIENVKCILKQEVDKSDIPKNESLNYLAYALDFNEDNYPDFLYFTTNGNTSGAGYLRKDSKWSLIENFEGKTEDYSPVQYFCD